jgi:hypothetical protein
MLGAAAGPSPAHGQANGGTATHGQTLPFFFPRCYGASVFSRSSTCCSAVRWVSSA